jgi:DNA repair photolyase
MLTFDPIKGRGARANPTGRFARTRIDATAEFADEYPDPGIDTQLMAEQIRSIISTNQSPDISFRQSINPYRGCEHGCVYCYARPSHAYADLSSGLDFETRIFFKPDAAAVLRRTLTRPGYRCQTIALGANTDAYQPAEKGLRITRALLEVLAEHRHPVAIVTKSALVERDIDILAPMAAAGLVRVMVSVTTLDDELKRRLEPRTASPKRRLRTIAALRAAGIPVGTMVAPVIPGLTDHELDAIVEAVAQAGADCAAYVLLRLPHDVSSLFEHWLQDHYPMRAAKVMSLIGQLRAGRANDPCFGSRMRGTGPLAALLHARFNAACRRHGLATGAMPPLDTTAFRSPGGVHPQLDLLA